MSCRAVIFGVAGQDGSYLAELLLAKGYEVVGVTRRVSNPNLSNLAGALDHPRFQRVEGDVTDAGSVGRILFEAQPHEVYNLAAQSHVGTSFLEPAHTTAVVYGGALNILEGCRLICKEARVYQASSSEMFGSAFSMRTRMTPKHPHYGKKATSGGCAYGSFFLELDSSWYEDEWFQNEQTPFKPNSPYAIAKLAAHNLCRVYRESYGLAVSCGILFNHESPRRPEAFVTRKVTRWAARQRLRHQQGLPIETLHLGNLSARRDWGFAADYVEAMWLMLQQDQPDDYVIATGQTHSVRQLVEKAIAAAGLDCSVDAVVATAPSLLRPSEVPYLLGDSRKARLKLGWSHSLGFHGLVKHMVDMDYQELRDGL